MSRSVSFAVLVAIAVSTPALAQGKLGLGKAACQGEPDAVPVAPVGPAVEDEALGLVHTGALVGDVDRDGAGGLAHGDGDGSAPVRDGVVHQDGEHLPDRRRRRVRVGRALVDPQIQVPAVQGQTRGPFQGVLAEERPEVDGSGRPA